MNTGPSGGRYFDGVTQYATLPATLLATRLTIECSYVWLAGRATLLADSTPEPGWRLGFEHDGELACAIAGQMFHTGVPINAVRDEHWHQFTLMREGSRCWYYLDGERVHEGTVERNDVAVLPWTLMKNGLSDEFIEGWAADMIFYEHAQPDERPRARWQAATVEGRPYPDPLRPQPS